jgi:hypothetical protein
VYVKTPWIAYNAEGNPAAMRDDCRVQFLMELKLSVMRKPPIPIDSFTISSTSARDFLFAFGCTHFLDILGMME